jgi:G3E family GTPase
MAALGLRQAANDGEVRTDIATKTRIPMVVVTGYLGSGKTTFIASLLRRPAMAGAAVIVNELAAVGIDQAIIADAGADDVVLLRNGCLCCAAGGDLRNAVARLLRPRGDGAPPLRQILIETSGAADPGPILRQICFDPALRNQIRNGGVVTLFDILHGEDSLVRDSVGLRQIGLADAILLSKADLAGNSESAAAAAYVRGLNPSAQIVVDRDSAFQALIAKSRGIAGTDARDWLGASASALSASPVHESPLITWAIEGAERLDWPRVQAVLGAVFDRYGDDILRTKGIVWTRDDDRPLVIQGIGRQFHRPVRLAAWSQERGARLVIIGFSGAAPAIPIIQAAINGRVVSNDATKNA